MLARYLTGIAVLALCACSSPAPDASNQGPPSGSAGALATQPNVSAGSGGLAGISGSAGTAGMAGAGGLSAGVAGVGNASGGSGGAQIQSGGSGGVSGSAGASGAGAAAAGDLDPEYLFTKETFGGNGRTCVTCHTTATGTLSSDQIKALYSANAHDPLFQTIDSDDGAGSNYTQLQDRATIRVTINLPAGVHLTADPNATSITVRRGIPTTFNTPALDPTLMWDGREPDLTSQAASAILGHAQGTVTPTSTQLDLIAQFEKGLFSSDVLRQYAAGGAAPSWPPGTTDEEKRGRRWFAEDSAAPRFNICGQCHGGPMTNETQSNSGLTVGAHFQTVSVSEFNLAGDPTYEFSFPDPKNPGKTVTATTPDPGRALITGDYADLNFFKIPPLWGIKNTAPYFHDNSAATLEDVMTQYDKHMATFLPMTGSYPNPYVPTTQDNADIVAYLKLL